MKNPIKILALLLVMCGLVYLSSCKKKHDDPTPLTIVTATANLTDLNGVTPPTNVATDAVIVVTFTTDIDAATATSANVTLTRDFDHAVVETTVSSSGPVLTITPNSPLNSGALFVLSLGTGLKSTGGLSLTAATRSFTTAGTFEPDGVVAHWSFENTTDDVTGDFPASTELTHAITFVDSHNATAGKAASFDGSTSIIEVPGGDRLMASHDFALSFWIKASSAKNEHFVMGLAGWYGFQFQIIGQDWDALDKGVKLAETYELSGGTNSEETWYNGNPNDWQGSTFAKDVTASGGVGVTYFKDKWAQVVVQYDAAAKVGSMYINNEKVRSWDFNLWPDGDDKKTSVGVKFAGNANGNKFAIGHIQGSENRFITDDWANPLTEGGSHFQGLLDDIRVYNRALTTQEMTLMYNSENQ